MGLLAGTPGISRRRERTLAPAADGVDRRPLRKAGAHIVYEISRGRLPAHIRGSRLAPSAIRSRSSARNRFRPCFLQAAMQRRDSSIAAPRRGIIPSVCCVISGSRSTRPRRRFAWLRPTGCRRSTLPFLAIFPPRRSRSPASLQVRSRRRLVIEDVGINETRTGFVRTLQAMGAGSRSSPREWRATNPWQDHRGSGARFAASRSAARLFDPEHDRRTSHAGGACRQGRGTDRIRDAQELKDKDTNRIATTVAALARSAYGSRAQDGFVIEPSELSSAKSLMLPPIIALSLPR